MAPKDSQVIIENGRVSALFKTINGVAIILISALLLWMAGKLTELNAQVAVLISQNTASVELTRVQSAARDKEHDRMNERISAVEDHSKNGHQ